jgi:hypothetical protein
MHFMDKLYKIFFNERTNCIREHVFGYMTASNITEKNYHSNELANSDSFLFGVRK